MSCRLDPQPLEWINRSETLNFQFEGRAVQGFAGDCITSALLASGQTLLGRSFKYHRPRSVLSLANHDVNALFESAEATNIRGDVVPLQAGMNLRACHANGSLEQDKDAWLGAFSRFLPVGFYYKTFHKPKKFFPFWEKIIRQKAGLGRISTAWSVERQAKQYAFCDLLVIGAGASGLQAALTAAEAGADVVLADENPHLGGSLDYQYAQDAQAASLRDQLKQQVYQHPRIRVFSEHMVCGWYTDHYLPLVGPQGITKLRAQGVIFATGVMEQPAVFRNNDLPGVMLASAAQRLITRYAIKPGKKAVILAGNAEAYSAALDLLRAGVEIAAIVDLASSQTRGEVAEDLRHRGVKILDHSAVYEACGKKSLQAVVVAPFDGRNCDSGLTQTLDCDLLLTSVGWAPTAQLLYQAKAQLAYDTTLEQLLPVSLPSGIQVCGRVNGAFTLAQRLADAKRAAQAAVAELRGERLETDALATYRDSQAHSHPWPIVAHPKGKNFVDFDEDLQLKDLYNAAKEGFDNIELIKRFSTNGMGPSQGKHANMNGIRILAQIRGQSIDATGSTTARPMFHPVPISALAGRRFRPERCTAMHAWHLEHQAKMMEAGVWLRPEYYARPGLSREEAIFQEVEAVRKQLGLIDVSTLGKIEVLGPDAARLLDLVYTMKMSTLKIGMTRYALMVDQSGVIVDDGIVGRLAEDQFYVTATTSHADATFKTLSRLLVELGLEVRLVNRTGSLAAMNLAGRAARQLLSGITDIDLSEAAFPYLGIREGQLLGHPVRLIRVGFVGELGYEIHLSAQAALEVWNALMQAGAPAGIRPFGVEAQRVLRLEKGHIIVGQDTDGLTHPYEANMAWAVPLKSKAWFTGKASLARLQGLCQRQLIGFCLPPHYQGPIPKECHLLIEQGEIIGRITSIAPSPALGRVIGLAMVDLPWANSSKFLQVRVDGGALVEIEVCSLPFYDAEGLRQTADLTEVV
ncbi:2Fe-2S iron-sulfur cluster-binding protein [Nitrincola tapanii]|uniref:FAD-dependent oxidoreductase n=1 Tax=Nitrincola tapanii TaxID=1708751 RepID=A0A5A9W2L2_9GAMM|nr:2Fe-2S iron-sulfur cluster-binding protein [Nitrincola tapanii]KAA0874429.1 FAD-dependent oxidoreductase [Nitrincola tapanii]